MHPTDTAATATIRARKGIAYLTDTSAFWAQKSSAQRARHECRFVDSEGHEPCDPFQPLSCYELSCYDSFLRQGSSVGWISFLLAYRPETTASPTNFASLHISFGTVDAEKVL